METTETMGTVTPAPSQRTYTCLVQPQNSEICKQHGAIGLKVLLIMSCYDNVLGSKHSN